jgi:hypothetical protein
MDVFCRRLKPVFVRVRLFAGKSMFHEGVMTSGR